MRWKRCFGLSLAAILGGSLSVQAAEPALLPGAQLVAGGTATPSSATITLVQAPADQAAPTTETPPAAQMPAANPTEETQQQEPKPPEESPLGPTPPDQVGILQNALLGKDSCIKMFGWLDTDYTYNSTGPGKDGPGLGLAPVMNRFGNEFLVRQIGLDTYKPLGKPDEWSWGFNSILIAGADAAFLNPTAGWFNVTDPRFGLSFTDLNLTAHLPILTDGGVDVKAGRQTTCLGPMGALPFQRYFDSSDYTWYNEEEGRYTGVSTDWHITKQLDWYNGIEIGGWGVFYDNPSGPDYLGQINYWLDEAAKKTELTLTVLTGPTGTNGGNTTVVEVCIHENWNKYVYQVIDTHLLYSKAPLFAIEPAPPGYLERSYSVYDYLGFHLNKTVDFNTRVEWYRDVDGRFYPGGFGTPKTNYYETTLGFDYHPEKWLQIRPEIRYDFSNNHVFGNDTQRAEGRLSSDQLSLACDVLIKF